jgi:von Willebrand factor type A domain
MQEHSPYNFVYSLKRSFVRILLIIIGISLLFLGLLSPRTGTPKILYILDSSLSMVTQDIVSRDQIYSSRFEIAKLYIRSSINRDPLSEYALMTFASTPRLVSPFSSDTTHLQNILSSLEIVTYGGGSDPMGAIREAVRIYGSDPSLYITLITDGELTDSSSGGISDTSPHITVIGIGTDEG